MSYLREFSTRSTPQSEPLPGQVPNNAGGNAWQVDDWARLRRFLILGAEGGSFYAREQALTRENAQAVQRCIARDGVRSVAEIVAVSHAGRAPKNDPAIFALALACAADDPVTRRAAFDAIPKVCRIGTHLFHFATYVEQFRGWGRGLKRAVAAWYEQKPIDALAEQVIKYRQRDGWSQDDMLRTVHPEPVTPEHAALFEWIAKPEEGSRAEKGELPAIIGAFERAQASRSPKETASIVATNPGLPREALNPDHLTSPEVWSALLDNGMPMTATIRNLATMTRVGVLAPMSNATLRVAEQITNADELRKARVHPLAVLAALATYQSGQSARGDATWTPVREIVNALDAAFYASFGNVEPTNQRTMLALDVSGSMSFTEIAGMPGITPRIGSAAMALVTAAVEPHHMFTAFTGGLSLLDISPRQRLDDVVHAVSNLSFGRTDCAMPILAAEQQRWEVDTFIVFTDSETWAGGIHPSQALVRYREKTGIAARLVVVGMVSNGFTIADPADPGMLDVVGFDTATPNVIAEFARA